MKKYEFVNFLSWFLLTNVLECIWKFAGFITDLSSIDWHVAVIICRLNGTNSVRFYMWIWSGKCNREEYPCFHVCALPPPLHPVISVHLRTPCVNTVTELSVCWVISSYQCSVWVNNSTHHGVTWQLYNHVMQCSSWNLCIQSSLQWQNSAQIWANHK